MAEIPNNRPRGREQHITGKGKDIFIHGEGLGTGPVGGAGGHAGRPTGNPASDAAKTAAKMAAAATAAKVVSNAANGGGGNGGFTRAAKRSSPLLIIIVLVVLFLAIRGCGGSDSAVTTAPAITQAPAAAATLPPASSGSGYSSSASAGGSYSGGQSLDLSSLLGGLSASSSSSGWTQKANTGTLNTTVAPGARAKRTEILGGGRDTVTLMVFMCGTDLESRSGMGTADLQEMAAANIGANVNLLVYTGGCRQWRNNVVSSSTNQIYKVESGGLRALSARRRCSACRCWPSESSRWRCWRR